jgi:branched-subunit amino acid permease
MIVKILFKNKLKPGFGGYFLDFQGRLIISLLMTFGVTTLEFQGIARMLNPVLEICYPGLILLTFYNLFNPSLIDERQVTRT